MVGADSCRRMEFPMVFNGEWVMHNGVQAPVANRSWLVPGADSCRRLEIPTVFDGEWVMHNGVQAPVANRSWLVPAGLNIYPRMGRRVANILQAGHLKINLGCDTWTKSHINPRCEKEG